MEVGVCSRRAAGAVGVDMNVFGIRPVAPTVDRVITYRVSGFAAVLLVGTALTAPAFAGGAAHREPGTRAEVACLAQAEATTSGQAPERTVTALRIAAAVEAGALERPAGRVA